MSLTILDLPPEVITYIFFFIPNKKDRRNLALICKRFNKIVRQQSKKYNRIDLVGRRSNSSLSIFEQSEDFPFKKLRLDHSHFEQFRDLWLHHGAKITQMTLGCDWKQIQAFGGEIKEFFPNLKTFIQEDRVVGRITRGNADKFSETIESLHLWSYNFLQSYVQLDSILKLFPGLKRLKLVLFPPRNAQPESQVKELKDILDNWLQKLDKIELSFYLIYSNVHLELLRVFNGWSHEKLVFDEISLQLTRRNIEILEDFFSISRHIKSLVISCTIEIAQTSRFFAFLNKNAKIDRLSIDTRNETRVSMLEGFFNAKGVKEIHISQGYRMLNKISFNPEALLKVTQYSWCCTQIVPKSFKLPNFSNLRSLNLENISIDEDELQIIIDSFPLLKELTVPNLVATNVGFSDLKHLRCLEIDHAFNLPETFFDFGLNLPNLESLKIYKAPNLTFAGIRAIVSSCPKLETIVLIDCKEITEDCVDYIAKNLFYIRKINVFNSEKLAAERIEQLNRTFPSIEII